MTLLRSFRALLPTSLICLVPMGFVPPASAQTQAQTPTPVAVPSPQSRVTQRIDLSSRVTLRGNTHPLATVANDRGPAPQAMRADRLLLLLRRSAQQEAALQTWIRSAHDPNSPNYRQWLTPGEFGRRFGISDSDLAAVTQWLAGQGLTVNRLSAGRIAVEFSGTIAQVQAAFNTSIHSYVVAGQQHWANASDPQVPAALAPVVGGVVALHNFSPRSQAVRGPTGQFNARTQTIQPNLTTGSTSNGYYLWVGPADAATIYDAPTTLNAGHSGTLYDGTGITIGIAGDSNIDTTQNDNYRATFGLPAKSTKVVVDGLDPGENGDAIEAYLDTEVAAGIAPGANVVLYTANSTYLSPGLFLAIMRAVDDNSADILNVSFGGCELYQGDTGNQYVYDLWEQAAAQGISVTVSTGDNGSAGCDDQNTEGYAQYGLAVNGLASTPWNIAVGGTDFDTLYSAFPSSFTTYVDITNSLAGHRSALSYIPEEPWNDSTSTNGSIAGNLSWDHSTDPSYENIIAGGGGASSCVTTGASGCSAGYPVPTWQASFATGASGRNLPDLSLLAGNGLYGAVWALCTDQDYISPVQTQPDCVGTPTTGNSFNVTGVGGTSASAPAFAGILALAAQKAGGRLGQADYVLYDLAKSKYATVFHDIAAGNNSVACAGGGLDCVTAASGALFLSGFDTQVGFDEATGLGSVDATQLLNNWSNSGATATSSTLTLNGGTSALTITHGAGVAAQVGVTGSGGTPSGPVALVDSIDPATLPDSGAIASFPLSAGSADQTVYSLPGGAYSVSAHYGGDQTFAASDSNSIAITVNPESSTTNLTVRTWFNPATGQQSSTPYYGWFYILDAQPYGNSASAATPNGVATGGITFTSGSNTLGTAQLASNGIAELQTSALPVGADSLKAAFPGDASFMASTSAPVVLTVQPGLSTLNLTADKTSYSTGDPVTITVVFGGTGSALYLDSVGAAPTGTISFTDGTTTLGTASVTGVAGTTYKLASASATFTVKNLPWGGHEISASYSGDANYAASSAPNSLYFYIPGATTAMTLTPASSTITTSQSVLLTAALPVSGSLPKPTGTVTFAAKRPDLSTIWTSAAIAVANGAAAVTIPANTLSAGADTLSAVYSGDGVYTGNSTTAPLQVTGSGTVTPTMALTLPTAPVSGNVPVTVTVAGPSGSPVPTGSITMSGVVAPYPLTNGSATFNYPASLQPGPNTLTATYPGDSNYASQTATGSVTLMGTPSLTFNPANATVDPTQPLMMTVTVNAITGLAAPTGTITLSYGSYTSAATALSSGSAAITIPANTFAVGNDTLTATYSGDTDYVGASSTTSLTVQSAPASVTISGTTITVPAGATTGNTATITVTPAGGFTGQVTLTAQVTSGPANATAPPTFSFGSTSPVTITNSSPVTATLTVSTTAPTSAMLDRGSRPVAGWLAGGGSALACMILLIGPGRRRRWRSWLALVVLSVALAGSMLACGGGGSNTGGGGGGGGSTGTTTGAYTVQVTGTAGSQTFTTTLTLNVK